MDMPVEVSRFSLIGISACTRYHEGGQRIDGQLYSKRAIVI